MIQNDRTTSIYKTYIFEIDFRRLLFQNETGFASALTSVVMVVLTFSLVDI